MNNNIIMWIKVSKSYSINAAQAVSASLGQLANKPTQYICLDMVKEFDDEFYDENIEISGSAIWVYETHSQYNTLRTFVGL